MFLCNYRAGRPGRNPRAAVKALSLKHHFLPPSNHSLVSDPYLSVPTGFGATLEPSGPPNLSDDRKMAAERKTHCDTGPRLFAKCPQLAPGTLGGVGHLSQEPSPRWPQPAGCQVQTAGLQPRRALRLALKVPRPRALPWRLGQGWQQGWGLGGWAQGRQWWEGSQRASVGLGVTRHVSEAGVVAGAGDSAPPEPKCGEESRESACGGRWAVSGGRKVRHTAWCNSGDGHMHGPRRTEGHYAGWRDHARVTPGPALVGGGAYVWGALPLSGRRGPPCVHTTVSTWHISNADDSLPDASS